MVQGPFFISVRGWSTKRTMGFVFEETVILGKGGYMPQNGQFQQLYMFSLKIENSGTGKIQNCQWSVILKDNEATLFEVCKPNKNVTIFICILASHLASNSCTISTSDRFLNSPIGARVSFRLPLKFSYIYLWSDWQHCSIFVMGTVGNGYCWCWLVTRNSRARPEFQWLAVIEWCD